MNHRRVGAGLTVAMAALTALLWGMPTDSLETRRSLQSWGALAAAVLALVGVAGGRRACLSSVPAGPEPPMCRAGDGLAKDPEPLLDRVRLLETVIDTADVWINTLDMEARVVIWNRAAEHISGYLREEVQGRSEVWAWLYPDDTYRAEITRKAVTILQQNDVASDLETTLATKAGPQRTILWNSRCIRDPEGRIIGSIAVGQDVTELRKAEAEFRKVHAMQRLILEHNVIGMAYLQERHLAWVNPRTADVLGTTLDHLVGAPERLLFPDENIYRDISRRLYTLVGQGRLFDERVRLKRASGHFFWCRMAGMGVDPDHPLDGIILLLEDIDQQVAAEASLAESEARFRGAFEGTQDALLLLTRDGIFDCNQRALDLFGFAHKSEVLRLHPADLSPARQPCGGDSRVLARERIQSVMQTGGERFRWQHRTQKGRLFTADILLSTFMMGPRRVIQACVRDISDAPHGHAKAVDEENRFRLLFERYAEPLFLLDGRTGTYLDVNLAALEMLRCTWEELKGLAPADLSPSSQPDGAPSDARGREVLQATLMKGSHRFRWVFRSAQRGDFSVDVQMVVIQRGDTPLIVVSCRNAEGLEKETTA